LAAETGEKNLRVGIGNRQHRNFQNAARVFAADETAGIRDGAAALALANRANDLTGGEQPFVLDALGMACAENRDFTNAIAAV